MTIDQIVRPVADAFEKKYGIRVDYVRADSNVVALRIHDEAQSGKVQADVFDGTAAVAALKKENSRPPMGAGDRPIDASGLL